MCTIQTAYELFFCFVFIDRSRKKNRDTINNWHKRKKLWKFVNGKDGKWTDKTLQNEAMVMLIAHKYEWQSLSFVLGIKERFEDDIVFYVNWFICTGNLLKRKHCVWQSRKFVEIACSLFTVHEYCPITNVFYKWSANQALGSLMNYDSHSVRYLQNIWIFFEGRCSFYTVHELKV